MISASLILDSGELRRANASDALLSVAPPNKLINDDIFTVYPDRSVVLVGELILKNNSTFIVKGSLAIL